jgi:hypothetical protein
MVGVPASFLTDTEDGAVVRPEHAEVVSQQGLVASVLEDSVEDADLGVAEEEAAVEEVDAVCLPNLFFSSHTLIVLADVTDDC